MDFPEFFQRSLLWMVAKSCTTKRKVETCCNPNKSNGMFTIYPLAQDFFHLFTALRCLLREPCRNSTWHMMPLPDSCTNRSRWSTRVRVRRSFRCFIVMFFQQRAQKSTALSLFSPLLECSNIASSRMMKRVR